LNLSGTGKIFSNLNLVLGSVIQFSREHKTHIPFIRDYDSIGDTSYEGAFVREPKISSYKDGVAAFYIQSLYPSIMIGLNMSPETYVGRIIEERLIRKTSNITTSCIFGY